MSDQDTPPSHRLLARTGRAGAQAGACPRTGQLRRPDRADADADDPFIETTLAGPLPTALEEARPRRRRFSFAKLAIGALGLLLSLAIGLWIDRLVTDLFSRNDLLGWLAIGAAATVVLALLAIVAREMVGIMRLNAVQALKQRAAEAALSADAKTARATVLALTDHLATRAETARGRERLKQTEGEIIDAGPLLQLAERELLQPLDREARALILNASKRVSIVTAVSPRALVDLGYVIFESARLIRAMAELYGGRPARSACCGCFATCWRTWR